MRNRAESCRVGKGVGTASLHDEASRAPCPRRHNSQLRKNAWARRTPGFPCREAGPSPLPTLQEQTESVHYGFGKTKPTAAIAACEPPSIRRLACRADCDGEDREQRAGRHEEEHLAHVAAIEELAEDDRRHDAGDIEAARD